MLNLRSCSSLCRSIVHGGGGGVLRGGRAGRQYRSIRAGPAVLASAQILIHCRRRGRPLLPAVISVSYCSCLTCGRRTSFAMATAGSQNTSSDPGIVLKIVAASVCIADRAGGIVRNIMSAGNLGIVEKVYLLSYRT